MANPGDFAYTVKQQADIVRVIGEYVSLKKTGAQNFGGLCPFHKEKTPSFSVHATRQFYHCFGCGDSGDVFKFVQKIENISFPEAVRAIAQKLGIAMPKATYASPEEARQAKMRGALLEIHERATKFFEDQLRRPEAAHAREYLRNRGLNDETIARFRMGFAPDSGFILRDRLKTDFPEELLRESGLFGVKEGGDGASSMYSRFRNRVTFPICNEQGRVIAFTARTLATDEKAGPKYLNSPETPIYSKGHVLFNLNNAKEAIRSLGYSILVEGQMDCISVFAAGLHNVIATSGTAFTEHQVRLLGRFSKNIVVNFDPDTAGANAAEKSLAMLVEEDFQIKVVTLEQGFDPDLFIRRKGLGEYAAALKSAPRYFDYLIERARAQFPVRTPEGKAKAVAFLLPHLKRIPNAIVRDETAADVAQKLGVEPGLIREEVRKGTTRGVVETRTVAPKSVNPAERVLIRALASAEFSDLVREALLGESLHEDLGTQTILDRLLHEEGDPMSMAWSDAERRTLAEVLLDEAQPLTTEGVQDSLSALRRGKLQARRKQLTHEIAEAERRNDAAAIARLAMEKMEVERRLSAVMRS